MNIQRSFDSNKYAAEKQKGDLFLVATPIGNLEDMTFRAIRTLKEAAFIAAEDTRHTRKLLTHFEISTRLVSYHEHNKTTRGPEIIERLLEGQDVALVSDAGLPAISDPGFELVQLAVQHEISVIPIPGANAALSALIISGLSTESFTFAGFLPRDKKKLREALDKLKQLPSTLICYEAPHRLIKTLEQMAEAWGDRKVALVRELTKKYEEALRGRFSDCLNWLREHSPQGEYCIIVEGAGEGSDEEKSEGNWWEGLTLKQHVEHYEQLLDDRKEAMKRAAGDRGVSKRDIYNELLKK